MAVANVRRRGMGSPFRRQRAAEAGRRTPGLTGVYAVLDSVGRPQFGSLPQASRFLLLFVRTSFRARHMRYRSAVGR